MSKTSAQVDANKLIFIQHLLDIYCRCRYVVYRGITYIVRLFGAEELTFLVCLVDLSLLVVKQSSDTQGQSISNELICKYHGGINELYRTDYCTGRAHRV